MRCDECTHRRDLALRAVAELGHAGVGTDWTERVPHVAGRIGTAVVRVRQSRALGVTDRGRAGLARELGVNVASFARRA